VASTVRPVAEFSRLSARSADRVAEVLAVVQHQQQLAAPQPIDEHRLGGACDGEGIAHRERQRGHCPGILEPDEPSTVWLVVPTSDLDRQPGLADARRPHQGHQPMPGQQGADLRQLAVPSDQSRGQGR